MVHHSCAHSHTSVLVPSIPLTHPSPNGNLHRWCFVMMSPSSLPQGGYWGVKSPTGHPWHPRVPLPSIPRWGNRMWWRVLVLSNPALRPDPLSAPPPPFSRVCRGKFPPHPHILNAAWHPLTALVATVHIQKAPISPHTPDLDCQSALCELENESVILTFLQRIIRPENQHLLEMMISIEYSHTDWLPNEAASKCCLVAHCSFRSCGGLTWSGFLPSIPPPTSSHRPFPEICLRQCLWMVLHVHGCPLTSTGMCYFTCTYVQKSLILRICRRCISKATPGYLLQNCGLHPAPETACFDSLISSTSAPDITDSLAPD